MSQNIDSSEISIVIQGRFIAEGEGSVDVAETNHVVDTWRHLLPDAQIIVSTWEQPQHVSSAVDAIVISQDPGVTVPKCAINLLNNVGRQILSTKAGLKKADRQFAIKTRTDIKPLGTGFISLFLEERPRHSGYQLFDMPVVTCTFCTLDPKMTRMSMHVSDIFHFGMTPDLLKLWDIPVPPALSVDSLKHDYGFDHFGMIVKAADCLLRPEQYIFLKLIQITRPEIQLIHSFDENLQARREGECYLFNNFTVRPAEDVGVRLPARMTRQSMMKKIYSMKKIRASETLYGNKDLSWGESFNFKDCTRTLYQIWRAAPQNMRIPCWLAAIFLAIQTPNIIFNLQKVRKWYDYRSRGKSLRNKLSGNS
jgi:hypothetical protein